MHSLWIVMFAIASGFTASGIVASLYRISGVAAETSKEKLLRNVVLVVAGPTVIFEAAVNGLLKKEWSPVLFWLVVAGISYWSLGIGLFILDVVSRF
jgi:hypothetical protein